MKVIAVLTGKEVYLTAKHVNRTVKLHTKYDIFEKEFIQSSRLDLGPTAWISYDLNLKNKTEVIKTFSLNLTKNNKLIVLKI